MKKGRREEVFLRKNKIKTEENINKPQKNNKNKKSKRKTKDNKNKKKKQLLFKLLYVCFIITFIISASNIILWNIDNNKTNNEVSKINRKRKIKKIKDNKNTEIIKNDVDKSDPYWDFIKMNLIDVDFKKLKSINNDVIGWIQVNGTNINYPVVQTDNNDFYLNHSFNKKGNGAGWVFLDYRNNIYTEDKNLIIYAHGRENKTMFGTLKNILNSSWVKNKNNYVVKLSTEYENTLWQVFSIYKIPTTNDYLIINFSDNSDFLNLTNKLLNRSNYNFKTTINENDRILTLSTCYNNSEKVVLHAKLIKRERK